MRKGIGKGLLIVALGFMIASIPTVVQKVNYENETRVHMSPKLDWGSKDETNIDDPEDYQALDRGTVNVVLFNGKAKPLANIDFTLFTASEVDGSLQTDRELGKYTTDEDGSFKLDHIQESKVYCLKESGVEKGNGLEQYFVVSYEDAVDAYPDGVQVLSFDSTLSLIIDESLTNTYKVSIQWVPPVNTPKIVKVNLLRNGKPYDSVELSEASNWEYTFTNLLSTGEYTVEEEVPANYKVYYQFVESGGSTSAVLKNTVYFNWGTDSSWVLFAKVGTILVFVFIFIVSCWYFTVHLPNRKKINREER